MNESAENEPQRRCRFFTINLAFMVTNEEPRRSENAEAGYGEDGQDLQRREGRGNIFSDNHPEGVVRVQRRLGIGFHDGWLQLVERGAQ